MAGATPALAQPAPQRPAPSEPAAPRPEGDGAPHTVFQIGVGLLALPGDVFNVGGPTQQTEPGETSIALSLANLGRIGDIGFGAGFTVAFGLRPAASARDPDGSLGREHSRGYLLFEGQFRYYLPTAAAWEWWVGGTLGAVVINDSWSTLADREPYADTAFVGPRAVTLSTEGFAASVAIGGHWRFAERWLVGTRFRYANWFLPGDPPETTPTGDPASLSGRIDVFDFGIDGGFLLPL